MQQILAIAWLTWKAALRFRLFLVIAVLLLASVVGLPLLIKDDGTARGFTQILLTYTLSVITGLLGLSTLWLSCGTLARDIEECQMQVVATKPIARWQIWLGKWLGIVSLNAALLALSGACVYGLLQWRAARLPAAEQKVLREAGARGARFGASRRITTRRLTPRRSNFAGTVETDPDCRRGFAGGATANPRAGQGRSINSCRRTIRASGRLIWASPKISCTTSRCNCA